VSVVAVALGGGSTGVTAVASPTFRLAIVHAVHGCHAWSTATKVLGPSATIRVTRGTRVQLRANCPMDFNFQQVAGPRLALGNPRTIAGTVRTIVFRRAGVYRLVARNVESSQAVGLQTLGPDNVLSLTVVVK
jgi:hypothetical protein